MMHVHSYGHEKKVRRLGVDLRQGFIQAELPKDGKAIYISLPPGHVEEPGYQVLEPLYDMSHLAGVGTSHGRTG
jgi:hypothetical protein